MNEMRAESFLTPRIMAGEDWRALERSIARLLNHCGWKDVQVVGQSGDKGADVIGSLRNKTYLVQVKAVSGDRYIGVNVIDESVVAQGHYGTDVVVVATNGDFRKSAERRAQELREAGFDVRLWNGAFLLSLLNKAPDYSVNRKQLRDYQQQIVQKVIKNFNDGGMKSLFIVATGLGKTIIAASIVNQLRDFGLRRILVLCHSVDLAKQLEKSFWDQLSKQVPTRLFMEGEPPVPFNGINFGLYQTLYNYLGGLDEYAFDLIVVDEAHHALANAFATCLNHLTPKHLIGMTATPWRGDQAMVESVFGEAVEKVSLIDGMRMGFLARVDYRVMCDNINWDIVPRLSSGQLSIRDLNKKLFFPQRDDAIVAQVLQVSQSFIDPRIVVFSPSKNHAAEFAKRLSSSGLPAACLSIDDKVKRWNALMEFSTGRLKAVTAVDVLNEGIDVPEVNVLVFLRATHSRRIFVQQLGRGLRLSPGKDKAIVLDFVSDIRRIAATVELDREARSEPKVGEVERVILKNGIVTFSDERAQKFVDAWIHDVAGLQDRNEAEKLHFPQL